MKRTGVNTKQPSVPSRQLRMEDYVPYQLAMVSSRLSHALEEVFGRQHGLARTEWRVLALACQAQGCTASDLVSRSAMDAVAVHRAIKRLEELGLVERTAAEQDKRVRPLRVTGAGLKIYRTVVPHALALESRMFDGVVKADADAFRRVLQHLAQARFDAAL